MSRLLSPPVPYTSRPTLVDYYLLLLGCGLSLYLTRLGPMPAAAEESRTDPGLREFVALLPEAMRLPEGVLLLWPVFLALQRLRGRRQGLTFGEWLWVLAWLGTALLTGLSAWERWVDTAAVVPFICVGSVKMAHEGDRKDGPTWR
jgi:hypothetical protein